VGANAQRLFAAARRPDGDRSGESWLLDSPSGPRLSSSIRGHHATSLNPATGKMVIEGERKADSRSLHEGKARCVNGR